ncbi:hypothetical protein WOLCODRAFT_27146 [Wolfiporia cocos MD-104 SS10]|uniref:C2H2-type domain-containing protein n=1 Tax=Wolfiporia cocos (strain MD-104) TaxID=742152 RepID=A0A2H3JRZ0_WOLCO|nr:hypothetical protein WOLCODRAFT_27146 [Wolfiporia cocos MD-104 SS10]
MPDISEPSGAPLHAPVVCLWDGCGIPLDDVTVGGIRRHLRAFHFHEAAEPYKGKRGACLWACGAGNHSCNRELDYASFGKHIASVHIRSTARRCGYCAAMIGRIDSLHRHMREHCPKRPMGMDKCPEDQ